MSDFLKILQDRRSVRHYTDEKIPDEKIAQILDAGLLSPSGKAIRPWEFIVVRDKEVLKKMAGCRQSPVSMFLQADAAIVVIADKDKSDTVIEDCSIVMSNMHLMADSLGLGSCWIQGRLRIASNGQTTEEYLRGLLHFPENYMLEAALTIGAIERHPSPRSAGDVDHGKIHWETY